MGETTTCGNLPLLPEDFFIQILLCLPVTSMLRFKSVCKSWRALIQSSFFIDLHTTTLNSSSKFGAFIVQTMESSYSYEDASNSYSYGQEAIYGDDINMFMLSSGSSDGEDEDDNDEDDQKMVFKVDDLGFLPFNKDFQLSDALRMVGSCNGIICLLDFQAMDDLYRGYRRRRHHYSNYYSNPRDVSLWNPATRQFRILPKSIHIEERKKQDVFMYEQGIQTFIKDFVAFGFDVKTKDYKVLRITPFIPLSYYSGGCMCRVQVYSLSTDSWSLLEDINYLPIIPDQGIYLNGSYFFVGRKSTTDEMCDFMLLSFDFTKEIFTSMQLPDLPDDNIRGLSCMGEKLAVFTTPRIDDCDGGYEYYDIWVLIEQHDIAVVNKESWTKLHTFRIKREEGKFYIEPRCISNNGEFALISTRTDDDDDDDDDGNWRNELQNKLQLFNLVTKEAKKDFLIGTRVCRADVYKESLVSIMGGNVLLKWQLPKHTTYILNLDAPFMSSNLGFQIGLCLTSDTGACIGVKILKRYVEDAAEGEALAMLEAIKWAKKLELSPIIIESNSKKCLSFFIEDDNNLTNWSLEALSLLSEAKLLLNSSTELGVQYCSRSCNYDTDVTVSLAKEGYWPCKGWNANCIGEMEWLGL